MDTKCRMVWQVFSLYFLLLNSCEPSTRHCFQTEAVNGTWHEESKGVSFRHPRWRPIEGMNTPILRT